MENGWSKDKVKMDSGGSRDGFNGFSISDIPLNYGKLSDMAETILQLLEMYLVCIS